jgi:hypothetical protein
MRSAAYSERSKSKAPLNSENPSAGAGATRRRHEMRCFWEQTGVIGPIYRSLGQGLNDGDIARKLNLNKVKVQSCIAWILRFLNLKNRQELVLYASTAA